jgi:hypothetical protein
MSPLESSISREQGSCQGAPGVGKAERFIQTLLREWAYVIAYPSSAHRIAALNRWLHYYNWHRPHTALHRQPPISRVVGWDDLLRLHI